MKDRFYIVWMIVIMVYLLSAGALAAGPESVEKELFRMADPVGDEWGPGTYTYPTHEHFAPFQGLFDLTEFRIVDQDTATYTLDFSFVNLPNPWRSTYGFSHPRIQLYIDNAKGGSTELFQRGACVRLDPAAPWDVMIDITGWWLRMYRPDDRAQLASLEESWSMQNNPFDVVGGTMRKQDTVIEVQVPKEAVGSLKNARFFLLIGSFDSFGYDYYRDIAQTNDTWLLGGSAQPELAPRVLDLLVPDGMEQETVLTLAPGAAEYVTVPYIRISSKQTTVLLERTLAWILALITALILAGIVVMKSKKNPVDC